MARATGTPDVSLTSTWVQAANANQKFLITAFSGTILWRWSATQPTDATGHPLYEGNSFGDTTGDEKLWVRAKETATMVISKD